MCRMNLEDLKKEQTKLAAQVSLQDGFKKAKLLGGVDTVVVGKTVVACVVVVDAKSFEILDQQVAVAQAAIPYVSGLLAYRLLPATVEAYNKLVTQPDVLLVAGQGIAHPRHFGFASHLGLLINKPTIGVAQSLLVGTVERGKIVFDGEHVGFEATTREHARPVYVSPGHQVTLGSAISIVKDCIVPPHKMPEPIHLAHKFARQEAKRLMGLAGSVAESEDDRL